MAYNSSPRDHLLDMIERIKLHYDGFIPDGAGYMPGDKPSSNPTLCYQVWSLSAFPRLFDDVSPPEIKEAFQLWFRELDLTLPDLLDEAPALEEGSEDESNDGGASYEDPYSEDDQSAPSDVESDSEVRSGREESLTSNTYPGAVVSHLCLHPSPKSPTSPCAPFNVDSASGSNSSLESDSDSDSDSDSERCSSEAGCGEDGTSPLLGVDLRSQTPVAPPSPSTTALGEIPPEFDLWEDGAFASFDDLDEREHTARSASYNGTSSTSAADRFDFVYPEDGFLCGADIEDLYPSSASEVDTLYDFLSVPCLEEADRSQLQSRSPPQEYDNDFLELPVPVAKDTAETELGDGRDAVSTLPSAGTHFSGAVTSAEETLFTAEDQTPYKSITFKTPLTAVSTMVAPQSLQSTAPAIAKSERKRKRGAKDDGAAEAGPSTKKANPTRAQEIDEELFPCTMAGCTKTFKSKASVGRHIRSSKAHAQSAFKCPNPQCGCEFTRESSFLRHLGTESFAECLAIFLDVMGVESLAECDSQQIAAKCRVAYTPQAGAVPDA